MTTTAKPRSTKKTTKPVLMPAYWPHEVPVPAQDRYYRTTPLASPTRHAPEAVINEASAEAQGRHRSSDGEATHLDTSVIEQAWSRGEPALSFSYRQPTQHWTDVTDGEDAKRHAEHGDRFWSERQNRCLHPACERVVGAIAATQAMPQDPSRPLNPYHTYDSKKGDAPSEWVLARRAGTRTMSIDMVMGHGEDGTAITLADSITHSDPNPYTVVDPETVNQIEWERSAHYSGPTTYFRRKISQNTGNEFIAIDRWGNAPRDLEPKTDAKGRVIPMARCWYARTFKPTPECIDSRSIDSKHLEVAFVFEAQKPINYPEQRDAYINRILELTGEFLPYEEQRAKARDGAQQRLYRQQSPIRVPIDAQLDRDPFRFRFRDDDLHEPHESVDVSDLVTPGMALRAFGKTLDLLTGEEIGEIEDQIVRILTARGRIHRFTRHHMRNHDDWIAAQEARLHSNGAEFLASDEDAIESVGTSAFASSFADLLTYA